MKTLETILANLIEKTNSYTRTVAYLASLEPTVNNQLDLSFIYGEQSEAEQIMKEIAALLKVNLAVSTAKNEGREYRYYQISKT